MAEIRFTVPLTPVSVNHYAKHTRSGRHYVTPEARAFKDAVFYCRPRVSFPANYHVQYEVEAIIFLGKGKRGDVDNFSKVLLDSLVYSGLITSDDKVTDLILRKRRDTDNPRTDITVRTL